MRRVVLTLLVLAVFLPSAAFARSGRACGTLGPVVRSCCCPPRAHARPAQPETTLRAQCCAIDQATRVTPAPAVTAGAPQVQPVSGPAVLALPSPPPLADRPPAVHRALAPPPPDPSLFARRCALLL